MPKILLLAEACCPQAAIQQIESLIAKLGEGFSVAAFRENNLLGMIRRIRQHSYDQIHAWGVLPLLAAALTFKGTIHFSPVGDLTPRQIRLLKAVSSYRPFSAVMPSGLLADRCVGSGFPEKTVRMIPPGVDFASCKRGRDDALRQSAGLTPDHIAVASIAPEGHRDALWATAILHQLDPRWVFLHPIQPSDPLIDFASRICGPGVLREAPTSASFESILRASDFILSTSRDFCPAESIVHSMAFGLPIVGWATRFNSEYLEHRANAMLVKPGAIVDLSRRMLELKENGALQYQISDQARRTAYERCSLSKNIQGYRDLYQSAVDAPVD
jgi:glycosyltransferase involved in cell wall biosynthesis